MITLLTKDSNGVVRDFSKLVDTITWYGKKEGAPRSISVKTVPNFNIEIENGTAITFYWKDNPLFAGYIFKYSYDRYNALNITAYDQLIYLIKNKEIYLLKNVTGTKVLEIISQDFKLKTASNLIDTEYVIGTLIQDGKKLYDIIQKVLNETMKQTGKKFYIRDNIGEIEIVDTFEEITIPDKYILDIDGEFSIEDSATRARVTAKDKNVRNSVIANDEALQAKWGVLQAYEVTDEDLNIAQLTERTKELLKEKSIEQESINIDCVGIYNCISGNSVVLSGVEGSLLIESDSHTFKGNIHTMKLNLERR